MKIILIILACVVGIVACNQTEWWQEQERQSAAASAERDKPRIVSTSDDGCAVYTFRAGGDWRYFTRCGSDRVATERDYTVPCGKSRCSRTEVIETVSDQQERRP